MKFEFSQDMVVRKENLNVVKQTVKHLIYDFLFVPWKVGVEYRLITYDSFDHNISEFLVVLSGFYYVFMCLSTPSTHFPSW